MLHSWAHASFNALMLSFYARRRDVIQVQVVDTNRAGSGVFSSFFRQYSCKSRG